MTHLTVSSTKLFLPIWNFHHWNGGWNLRANSEKIIFKMWFEYYAFLMIKIIKDNCLNFVVIKPLHLHLIFAQDPCNLIVFRENMLQPVVSRYIVVLAEVSRTSFLEHFVSSQQQSLEGKRNSISNFITFWSILRYEWSNWFFDNA